MRFDPAVWRERAWNRLCKFPSRRGVESRWAAEIVAIHDLDVLVEWCAAKGLEVAFGKKQNGVYDPSNKRITISSSALPGRQLAYLLHEAGHHLIGESEHHERFAMGYPRDEDPQVRRKFKHKLACLEEELEAWHRGWRLARRLALAINRDAFDEVREDCIRSYVKWAAKRGDL